MFIVLKTARAYVNILPQQFATMSDTVWTEAFETILEEVEADKEFISDTSNQIVQELQSRVSQDVHASVPLLQDGVFSSERYW